MKPALLAFLVAASAHAETVWLTKIGPDKLTVIKTVRAATGLGLAEAKALVESAPARVKIGLQRTDAEALVAELQKAQAGAELRDDGAPPPLAEGQYAVKLESFGTSKIQCIKLVKDATQLGLADTKKLVESAPVIVKAGVSKEAAQQLADALNKAGGKATALLAGE